MLVLWGVLIPPKDGGQWQQCCGMMGCDQLTVWLAIIHSGQAAVGR